MIKSEMRKCVEAALSRQDARGQEAVTTAIIRIYQGQTEGEKHTRTTLEQNGRGFKAFDAKSGSWMATWALNGSDPADWDANLALLREEKPTKIRLIDGRFLHKAREIALRHAAQLTRLAEANLDNSLLEGDYQEAPTPERSSTNLIHQEQARIYTVHMVSSYDGDRLILATVDEVQASAKYENLKNDPFLDSRDEIVLRVWENGEVIS